MAISRIVTPAEVSAAVDALFGSVLADSSVWRTVGPFLSHGFLSYAYCFGTDVWYPTDRQLVVELDLVRDACNAIVGRFPERSLGLSGESWRKEVARVQKITPDSVGELIGASEYPQFADSIVAYLRRVQLSAPIRPIGPVVELVVAASQLTEEHNRFDLEIWRADLEGHGFWADESASTCDATPAPISAGRFSTVSLAAASEGVPYIIPGVIPERQPTVVGGPTKAAKTLSTLDLGISIVSGGQWFGHDAFAASRPRRFLFASAESGTATLRAAFDRICKAKGLDPAEVERGGFSFCPFVPRFDSKTDLTDFERLIRRAGAEVVALDPLYKCMGGASGTTLAIAGEQLHPIAEVCERCEATLIVVHHTTQSGRAGSLDLRSLVGAGVAEWARAWVIVDPLTAFKPATREHNLRLALGGSAGHCSEWRVNISEGSDPDPNNLEWDVTVRALGESREPKAKRASGTNSAKVLAALRQSASPLSGAAIRELAGITSGSKFKAAVDALIASGQVRETAGAEGQGGALYELAAKGDAA